MEAKSKNITIRFSAKELDEIKAYMKKSKIKSMNDFIRNSTGFFITFSEAMANVAKSKEITEDVDQFNKEFRMELDKVPSTEAKLRVKYQAFEKKILPKYEAEIEKSSVHAEPFTKKRKAGRPKHPKRKRGKPKN